MQLFFLTNYCTYNNDFITIKIEKVILGSRITFENESFIRKLIEEANLNRSKKIKIEKLESVFDRANRTNSKISIFS